MDVQDVNRFKALVQLGTRSARSQVTLRVQPRSREKNDFVASILYVDDEPSAREYASEVLSSNGYRVWTAASVEEATALLESHPSTDMMLLDLCMPGRDGFELLHFVDTNLRFRHIPAIVVSSYSQLAIVKRTIQWGASGFLVKPFSASMLLAKVTETLDASRGSILIVCTDEVVRRLLEQIFLRYKRGVVKATSIKETLQKLAEKRVDVVVCDLGLKDGTGPECLLQIRESGYSAPVFFIDDTDTKIAEEEAVSAGAQGLIKRPFSGPDIAQQVLAALQAQRPRRAERTGKPCTS